MLRPRPRQPLFQAATANLNPWTEVKVDHENPDRGPMLIIAGKEDHTVPPPTSTSRPWLVLLPHVQVN
jgi:hypothetical protein